MENFKSEGLYNVFWCVTIPQNVQVKDLAVQMLLSNANDESLQMVEFNETWSSELNPSPCNTAQKIRLMPREPIWIDKGRHLTSILTMELEGDEPSEDGLNGDGGNDRSEQNNNMDRRDVSNEDSAIVHYFELVPYLSGSCSLSDVFVLGFPLNASLSLVPPCVKDVLAPSRIVAIDVSLDQKYAASLSVNRKDLTVDVWDLRSTGDSNCPRIPVATAKILAIGPKSFDLTIAISSDGSHLAVFEEPKEEWKGGVAIKPGTFPAHFFENDTMFTPVDQVAEDQKVEGKSDEDKFPETMEKNPLATTDTVAIRTLIDLKREAGSPLKRFIGFAKFQHRSPGNLAPKPSQEHVFVACNGFDVSIYGVSSAVKLQYSILLPTPSPSIPFRSTQLDHRLACRHLINTLQDSRFVWNGDEGKVQVWNWRNGNLVAALDGIDGSLKYLHRLILSKDGSAVIAASQSSFAVYSAESGLLISKVSKAMSELRLFECLDSDRVMAAGWIEDTDGDGERDQVFRIMDLYCLTNVINVAQIQLPITNAISFHVIPAIAGDRENITTIVQHNLAEIQLVDLKPRKSDNYNQQAECCPKCDGESGSVVRRCIDNEQGCSYTLSIDDMRRSFFLHKISTKDGERVEILTEMPTAEDPDITTLTFLPCRKRFLVIRRREFELWQLPTADRATCQLLTAQARDRRDVGAWTVCPHGSVMRWKDSKMDEIQYVDISRKIFFGSEETLGLIRAIPTFIQCFETSGPAYRQAVIELLMKHINRHPGVNGYSLNQPKPFKVSIIGAIIKGCSNLGAEPLLYALLKSTEFGHWIPHTIGFSIDPSRDMIAYLVKESKVSMLRLVVDYLLARAHSDSPYYTIMLSISIPHFFPKYPELALHISQRSAFIPVKDNVSLIHEAIINVPQWRFKPHFKPKLHSKHKPIANAEPESEGFLHLWTHKKTKLYEFMDDNPVFQLNSQLPITTVAPTVSKSAEARVVPVGDVRATRNREIKAKFYIVPFSLVWRTRPTDPSKEGAWMFPATAWIRKALRFIWHFVFPLDTLWVHTHYSDLEAFDNPAIEAIIDYKWSRFARVFWIARLCLQMTYEALVLAVTFLQLYGNHGDGGPTLAMTVGYIVIIVLGYTLLHLEFQQMRGGLRRYFSSPYNYVDLCVARTLSFSIVMVYLHLVFEFRVFKSVCEVVTIVVNILLRIPAFFAILAVFILAFAHSINHLIEVNFRSSCEQSQDGTTSNCQTMRDEFPRDYLQSVSTTYFFMTGDYDPVKANMTTGHWTIQLMVGFFFFLTAVLMMNVVIALMNGVYSEAVEAGRRIWLKNRLDLIAGAENLSFYMPNFRQTHDFFPQYIYYTATDRQIKDYRKKFELDSQPLQFDFTVIKATVTPQIDDRITTPSSPAAAAIQEELQKSIAKMQEQLAQEKKEYLRDLEYRMVDEKKRHLEEVEARFVKEKREWEVKVLQEKRESDARMEAMMTQLLDRLQPSSSAEA
ncbi:hypothetical protein BGX26_011360 [Mortierella sp. AD094]|nr:hypothetical protein BGX26_011360 [Mortierella sp. AD094]